MIDEALNELAERVIGAAIEVHRHLGAGFLEATYERAFCVELELRGISYEVQKPVKLSYKDRSIGDGRIDLLVEGKLIIELKAISALTEAHKAQVLAYLKATDLRLGLLINFHAGLLRDGIRRIAN